MSAFSRSIRCGTGFGCETGFLETEPPESQLGGQWKVTPLSWRDLRLHVHVATRDTGDGNNPQSMVSN